MIQSRVMMGGIAAVIAVAAAWGSVWLLAPEHHGTVEIQQLDSRSWSTEITELGSGSVDVDANSGRTAQGAR